MNCECRCHAYGPGANVTCDVGPVQPGGNQSCTVTHTDQPEPDAKPCPRCHQTNGHHEHVDGDCVLRHRGRVHVRTEARNLLCCRSCTDRHLEHLEEIPDLWERLSGVVLAGSIPDDTAEHKHQKASASPSPIRLAAWALLHPEQLRRHIKIGKDDQGATIWEDAQRGGNLPDVRERLAYWARELYQLLSWGTSPGDVAAAAAVLRANADTMASHPRVVDYDADLRWIRRSLRRAHGLGDPQPLGDCLSIDCGGHVWPAKDASQLPRCDRCNRPYGTLDIARLRVQEEISATGETA